VNTEAAENKKPKDSEAGTLTTAKRSSFTLLTEIKRKHWHDCQKKAAPTKKYKQ